MRMRSQCVLLGYNEEWMSSVGGKEQAQGWGAGQGKKVALNEESACQEWYDVTDEQIQ